MNLELRASHLEAIRHHGEEAYPHECCGFLLGTLVDGSKVVHSTVRADNARETGALHNRFLITPDEYRTMEKRAREKKLDIIGFYHSHPDHPARPSQYDLDHAWPWYSYVIISVCNRRAEETTSWVMEEDRSQFDAEEVTIRE